MRYELRRKDRRVTESETRELLERGEYGILSTSGPDGQPYGIPLSYGVLDDAIYFHSAAEGHKLANIAADNRVSFCVVGTTEVLPEQFATRYESVVVTGKAYEVFDDEKQRALEGLLAKYSAGHHAAGLEYIAAQGARTRVFKICIGIDAICGKARR